jgi:fluoroquinolone resistance protein
MSDQEFVPGSEYDRVVWDHYDFTGHDLAEAQFSRCTFNGCDFSGLKLSATRFEACTFTDGNLSNTVVDHTRFDGVSFVGCKLVGLNFGSSDPLTFAVSLERCLLRYVNFSQLRWRKAVVRDCDAFDSDFRGAKLVGADFTRTRFRACRFSGADLASADFSHAEGYDLDLRTENLKKAVFTLPEALNLLAPFDLDVRN